MSTEEKLHFIEQIIEENLSGFPQDKLRFRLEPNGYLHIGLNRYV
jgi:hypothetical protein